MAYNGHPSRNAWNVALWIGNDEGLYNLARELKRAHGARNGAKVFLAMMIESCRNKDNTGRPATPDGCPWTQTNIRRAMEGL